jgi:hypothetical protein
MRRYSERSQIRPAGFVRGWFAWAVLVALLTAVLGFAPTSSRGAQSSQLPSTLTGSLKDVAQYPAYTDKSGTTHTSAYNATITATDLKFKLDPSSTPSNARYTLTSGTAQLSAKRYTFTSGSGMYTCSVDVQESRDASQPLTGNILIYGANSAAQVNVFVPATLSYSNESGDCGGSFPNSNFNDYEGANGPYVSSTHSITINQTYNVPANDPAGPQTHTVTGNLSGCSDQAVIDAARRYAAQELEFARNDLQSEFDKFDNELSDIVESYPGRNDEANRVQRFTRANPLKKKTDQKLKQIYEANTKTLNEDEARDVAHCKCGGEVQVRAIYSDARQKLHNDYEDKRRLVALETANAVNHDCTCNHPVH